MANYFKFSLLWMLTGSPVTAALILLALWAVADWNTTGFGRRAWRFVHAWRRGSQLERTVAVNPHDRKARVELGEILVGQRRFERAIEIVKPALEADQGDAAALYAMGLACLGAGKAEQGELFLSTVSEDPGAGSARSQSLLEIGRHRLARGDAQGAAQSLRAFLQALPSSVEGHTLLSQALEKAGDAAGAAAERERAWHEYRTALPYQRRDQRLWAWRARPSRPAAYLAILLALLAAFALGARQVDWSKVRAQASEDPVLRDE